MPPEERPIVKARLENATGVDISVANPLPVDASPSAVALTEILKTNDDALQSTQREHIMGRNLNDFYNGRATPPAGVEQKIDVEDYWGAVTNLTKPAGYSSVSIYSRKVFRYPILTIHAWFPTSADVMFGFEAGGATRLFIVSMSQNAVGTWGFTEGGPWPWAGVAITSFIPADYDTGKHDYSIVLGKSQSELYIDKVIRGIILHNVPEAIPAWANNPPYALYYGPIPAVSEITAFVEIGGPVAANVVWGLDANHFFIAEGIEYPPRQYALYNENTATKWNGQVIAAGSITSHPVPIWGYPIKTLCFQAGGAGSLAIQIYVGGGWRTAKTVPIVANTLDIQAFDMETPIMRCVFTPTGFPTTVTAAEVFLS